MESTNKSGMITVPGRKVESRISSGQRREIYLKDIKSDTSRDVISAPRAGIFYCIFSFVYVMCVCVHARVHEGVGEGGRDRDQGTGGKKGL